MTTPLLPGMGGGGTFTPPDFSKTPTFNLPTAPTPAPSAIAADAISAPVQPFKLPDAKPEPDYMSALASVPTIESILNAGGPTATENTQNSLMTSILGSLEKMGLKKSKQAEAENAAGLPAMNAQLVDVSNQIQALQKEGLAIPLQLQENAEGRGVTAGGLAPIQTGLLRQNAIKALSLSAVAQTLQGNITLAQSQVSRAIDLEFAPEQAKLDYLEKALEFNTNILSREDSKNAQAMNAKLDERRRILDQQKADRETTLNIMVEAAKAGADSGTINRLHDAKTPEEALAVAGTTLGNEFRMRMEQQQFERSVQLQQLAISRGNLAIEQAKFAMTKSQSLNNLAAITNSAGLASVLRSSQVGQGTKTQVANILSVINAATDLANMRPDGSFSGFNPVTGNLPNNLSSKEMIENRGYLDAINLKVQQWASGASLTTEQIAQVKRMTPAKTDTDRTVQAKLNNLVNFMNTQVKSQLQSEGINYDPMKVDLFAQNGNLDAIFKQ